MSSLATIPNPFRSSIVSDPWKSLEADVPSIHQNAFERCCEAIAAVRATRRTTGVLAHGEAGSGKTHLLARLRAQVAREAEAAGANGSGGIEEAIFVSVQLQTSAKMIWRHLRRRLASDLLRREDGAISQLERLLLSQLTKSGMAAEDSRIWLERTRKDSRGVDHALETLEELFGQIDSQGQISYKLRQVIASLLMKRHVAEAGAWLRGESLPKAALQKLGIDASRGGDEETGEAEEQSDQDGQVVFGLCALATSELPMVFCFDQIEALQTHAGERDGLFAFGQMVSELNASTQCLLVISCLQSAFLDIFSNAVRISDFARIKAFDEVTLNSLMPEQALQLVRARLDAAPELRRLRAAQIEPFWPLQKSEILRGITPPLTARRLLSLCADLFEARRGAAGGAGLDFSSPAPVNQFLEQAMEERRRKSLEDSQPSQTEDILKHGLPAAIYFAQSGWRQNAPDASTDVDLLFEGPQGTVALSVCNSQHWPSLVKKLDRLNAQLNEGRLEKLVLLRDGRTPIGAKAVKTRTLRDELLRKGARWVEPSVEALAALDALRRLLADAQSGDLANHGDTVGLKTVQDWLARNLAGELKDLLADVFPSPSTPADEIIDSLYENLAELLQRQHIVSVAHVAALLEKECGEIEACVQNHSDRLGALGNPPVALFRLVTEGLAV
jgi:hypothetical protein